MSPTDVPDVTCRSVMDASPAVLQADTSFRDSIAALLQHRLLAMPVVDAAGHYLGVFRKNRVIAGVLPQVAVYDDHFHQITRMVDAGLLRDDLRQVQERFATLADLPVAQFACLDTPVLRPDQPLVTALHYLYRGRNFLPVVDPTDHRLCGIISTWDVLESVLGRA
ncbi:CBS domain-containing protein [Actomonas aquatica]|uniref:CBS domain-containing protein n=1 Tax=Actomonas aquatica TaxID=2866162 RepID=A0ABZ1C6W6_9BACT|nr:CBS domain-containing protein [Opitutus sp. WL0086]WRQ87461.1 CBS domain-containing protein [Opitutus sp. WL0086]